MAVLFAVGRSALLLLAVGSVEVLQQRLRLGGRESALAAFVAAVRPPAGEENRHCESSAHRA